MNGKPYGVRLPGKPQPESRHTSVWAAKQAAFGSPVPVEIVERSRGVRNAWEVAITADEVQRMAWWRAAPDGASGTPLAADLGGAEEGIPAWQRQRST